ncbi:bis(5'-nucleosyl)-tetraphosphatase (symmetrical) YqeK [Deinococcus aestuarii]|uniref:bis(5'-nucleosyl)-tetraphosphatase (symmetrical) YqeK n=1 Tax=Deinococcus aestuarii TaxID=2774531 RepID=UPI001C0D50C0|nr:bis(5'-nucleosyl)-tetraphosphatase (symmetrical) YqeK [Deinococcus aestuarii]
MIAQFLDLQHPLAELAGWDERVRLMVRPRRYEHVLRVADLACRIARANGLDEARAYAAGLLHDLARDLPDAELLRLAPPECDIDAVHPLALHGRAARTLLERWGYRDPVVLEAVEDHTTGPRGGNPVADCVYVADVSEPGRGVNEHIRDLALHDLPAALSGALVSKVTYLQGRGITVHPRTLRAYHALPCVRQALAGGQEAPLCPAPDGPALRPPRRRRPSSHT